MLEATRSQNDRLMADLQMVIRDAEKLLRITAREASQGVADIRENIQHRLVRGPRPPAWAPRPQFLIIGCSFAGLKADWALRGAVLDATGL